MTKKQNETKNFKRMISFLSFSVKRCLGSVYMFVPHGSLKDTPINKTSVNNTCKCNSNTIIFALSSSFFPPYDCSEKGQTEELNKDKMYCSLFCHTSDYICYSFPQDMVKHKMIIIFYLVVLPTISLGDSNLQVPRDQTKGRGVEEESNHPLGFVRSEESHCIIDVVCKQDDKSNGKTPQERLCKSFHLPWKALHTPVSQGL